MAAMVPVERLEQMQRLARQELLDLLERQKGRTLTQKEADALANEAKHRTRRSKPRTTRHK